MFQATRRRLAIWYTAVTAVLLLIFASGFYLYVRTTLVERVDDTLSHVVEVVERSFVIEPFDPRGATNPNQFEGRLSVNVEASFRDNADGSDDDHIDLEWFSPRGKVLWSTLSAPLDVPLHLSSGETVRISSDQVVRQITQRVRINGQVLGYLRASHPWFEVTKPSRQLIRDLALWTGVTVMAVAAIGWFLSGLAIAPVRESYQQLKQFTADASHELRNPIAVIQTNVQVALSEPEPDAQFQQQQLQVIERLTRRLGRLVDDLLFLARQESGISPLYGETIDLNRLLHTVVEEQQTIATDKEIAIALTCTPPLATPALTVSGVSGVTVGEETMPSEPQFTLTGGKDQLIRLFTNLISNAVQYTPKGGKVDIKLGTIKSSGNHQLQIKVKDTGVGIPQEALPKLFDRFYRVDPNRSQPNPAVKGSGLGLAIARIIVENHQGQIQIESVLNEGTTVTVTLPISHET